MDSGESVRAIARLWATVELERALADLGLDGARVAGAVEDPLLGARVVVVRPAEADDEIAIALAEPSTEGRLALVLARNGEGPAGRYVASPVGLAALRERAAAAAVTLSRPAVGPFGPEVLVLGGPAQGPSLILVNPAAVPSRP